MVSVGRRRRGCCFGHSDARPGGSARTRAAVVWAERVPKAGGGGSRQAQGGGSGVQLGPARGLVAGVQAGGVPVHHRRQGPARQRLLLPGAGRSRGLQKPARGHLRPAGGPFWIAHAARHPCVRRGHPVGSSGHPVRLCAARHRRSAGAGDRERRRADRGPQPGDHGRAVGQGQAGVGRRDGDVLATSDRGLAEGGPQPVYGPGPDLRGAVGQDVQHWDHGGAGPEVDGHAGPRQAHISRRAGSCER
mmetsp:Transcript_43806/g.103123  ORF Transcript_43806/g.103123 Transcript_43806/m.103123 type:complete len:247 (-) Transcript_43806:284-1024(-)